MANEFPPVKSLEQFVKLVSAIRHSWTDEAHRFFNPWFRGQREASWGLDPSLYRNRAFDGREGHMRANFQRQGLLLVTERLPAHDWEWYFLMQHHVVPTRLLDWSDGALLALYFALCPSPVDSPKVKTDAAVWMLDAKWLNKQVVGKYQVMTIDREETKRYLPALDGRGSRQKLPKLPIALTPANIARRLGAQRSRFTIHGTDKQGLMKLARRRGSRLVKIIIAKTAIDRMRIDLTTCGIWDTTIFPDLEGLSREVIRDHTDNWI